MPLGGTGEQAHVGSMDDQDDSSSDDEFPVWSGCVNCLNIIEGL